VLQANLDALLSLERLVMILFRNFATTDVKYHRRVLQVSILYFDLCIKNGCERQVEHCCWLIAIVTSVFSAFCARGG